jgi:hypothetical protein
VYTYRSTVNETSLLCCYSSVVDYGFSLFFFSLLCRDVRDCNPCTCIHPRDTAFSSLQTTVWCRASYREWVSGHDNSGTELTIGERGTRYVSVHFTALTTCDLIPHSCSRHAIPRHSLIHSFTHSLTYSPFGLLTRSRHYNQKTLSCAMP